MNLDIKNYLQERSIALMDRVDELRITGQNLEFAMVLERAANLSAMSILHCEDLSRELIENVKSTMSLCDHYLKSEPDANMQPLENIVSSIEELFRKKKFLLDGNEHRVGMGAPK